MIAGNNCSKIDRLKMSKKICLLLLFISFMLFFISLFYCDSVLAADQQNSQKVYNNQISYQIGNQIGDQIVNRVYHQTANQTANQTENLADEINVSLDAGYSITAYDIQINIRENQVFYISETITAEFYKEKHGIYRYIPIKNSISHVIDGKSVTNTQKATISNVTIQDDQSGKDIPFDNEIEGNNLILNIGQRNKTITGTKTYKIHYQYALDTDGFSQSDEVNFNLIGSGWDTYIKNITFQITLPKEFDKDKITFATGGIINNDKNNISYDTFKETITGSVRYSLAPGKGLSVQVLLPEGYFKQTIPIMDRVLLVAFISAVLLSIILFLTKGMNNKIRIKADCTLPQNMTPADMGYIMGKKARIRGIAALIPYWANLGYLRMVYDSETITLSKIKEADDGMKSYEKIMFQLLFLGRMEVHSQDLKYQLDSIIQEVNKELHQTFQVAGREIYTKGRYLSKRWCYRLAGLCAGVASARFLYHEMVVTPYWSFLIIFLIFSFTTVIMFYFGSKGIDHILACFKNTGTGVLTLFFAGMIVLFVGVFGFSSLLHISIVQLLKIIGVIGISELIVAVVSYIIPHTVEEIEQGKQMYTQQMVLISLYLSFIMIVFILILFTRDEICNLGMVSAILCAIVAILSQKRTEQGNIWYAQILGLKQFLRIAGNGGSVKFNGKNTMSLYNLLPYAYTLGKAKKWDGIYQAMNAVAPSWYVSRDENSFRPIHFSSLLFLYMGSWESEMMKMDLQNSGDNTSSGDGTIGGGGGSW